MFRNFAELKNSIEAVSPKTMVVAAAHDQHTLEAVYEAAKILPMRYILVGDRQKILEISQALGVTPNADDIIEAADEKACAETSVGLIAEKRGDVLMKGLLETKTLLKAALDKDNGIRGTGTMTHLAILEVPGYHKLISVTDGGMIPHPTLEQKSDMIRNATLFYRRLGIARPKIAALAANETVSDKIIETVDAAELQAMCGRGAFCETGSCIVEGPISFDLAVSRESATLKNFDSQISGETDILLVPNITVGNVFMKGQIYWADAKMAGCILGAEAPVILASRGASAEEKLLSIMISMM